jgi:hypothetical protein
MAETAAAVRLFVAGDIGHTSLSGRRRMLKPAALNAGEIKDLRAGLLRSPGRPLTVADEISAEMLASTLVHSRRRRERGLDDSKERRQIALMLRTSAG